MWKENFSQLWETADTNSRASSSEMEEPFMDSDRVMKEILRLYTQKEVGLKDATKSLKSRFLSLTPPRQKVTVLIVGHHHLAKEKFLDLYFNDSRQGGFLSKVDYSKLDKILVTHGNQRKWLNGSTVIDYCPQLAQLRNVPGLRENLATEVATKHAKSLVSFILAPERLASTEFTEVDENNNPIMPPPSSVDTTNVIETLAEAADLIFVFFDPTGFVRPRITISPFQCIWESQYEKIHLILAKASENECTEEDREAVLTEIVGALWEVKGVQRVGHLPQIYWPDLTTDKRDDVRLWNIIQRTEHKSVERALAQLEEDADSILTHLITQREINEKSKLDNGSPLGLFWWFILILFLVSGTWVTQVNEILCRRKERDWTWVCQEFARNKAIMCSFAFLFLSFLVYTFWKQSKEIPLSSHQEHLLNRRIQFTQHALYMRQRMARIYATSSG